MINQSRLLETFLDYVRIDSESTREGAMAARLTADLEAIGCHVEVDDSASQTGSQTGNLFATLPATGPGEPLLLCAHMDTVVPGVGVEPVLQDGMIRSKGETILGGDDKSGVAAIVEALRMVVEQQLPHPEIQCVFTVCEELGLKGSRFLDYSKLIGKQAVVLDNGGDVGVIGISAPGQDQLSAVVVGRRSHAGVTACAFW